MRSPWWTFKLIHYSEGEKCGLWLNFEGISSYSGGEWPIVLLHRTQRASGIPQHINGVCTDTVMNWRQTSFTSSEVLCEVLCCWSKDVHTFSISVSLQIGDTQVRSFWVKWCCLWSMYLSTAPRSLWKGLWKCLGWDDTTFSLGSLLKHYCYFSCIWEDNEQSLTPAIILNYKFWRKHLKQQEAKSWTALELQWNAPLWALFRELL